MTPIADSLSRRVCYYELGQCRPNVLRLDQQYLSGEVANIWSMGSPSFLWSHMYVIGSNFVFFYRKEEKQMLQDQCSNKI